MARNENVKSLFIVLTSKVPDPEKPITELNEVVQMNNQKICMKDSRYNHVLVMIIYFAGSAKLFLA